MNQVEAILFVDAMPTILWRVTGATVVSALNEPYLVRLDIESEVPLTDPQKILGSSAALTLRRDLRDNVYGGIVSSVRSHHEHGGLLTHHVRAQIVIEPALAALRQGRNTKIFQEKDVPTVLREVLTEALGHYGREVEVLTQRSYPKREYTVQYQESDFAFVHRLMEEEGIVYQLEAGDDGIEKLVLLDAPEQHPPIEGGPIVEYSTIGHDTGLIGQEYVRRFEPVATIVGTEIATQHFDWTHPSAKIIGQDATDPDAGDGPHGASYGPMRESYEHDEPLTLHDYALTYRAHDVADQQRLRRERQARDALTFEGVSTLRAFRVGHRIELNAHAQLELNAAYTLVAVTHHFGTHAPPDGDHHRRHYHNEFLAVAADLPYRPRRVHPRPRIRGIQTAIVTGPANEEIHTDEHGRVKVQFHWDRLGELDDKTTCWIRCMQTWAGPGWGAFVLPRVGMEVVVSFIDGDVDRPLVTGCVYNGDRATPYELPAKKMVSTFKTNSYPGGDGYNELRFDDQKHEEEIWLHGEKDWNTVIEHDLTRTVRHDEHQTVGHNRTRNVGVNERVTVGSNRNKTVGANETLTVGANRTRMVGVDESVTIGQNQKLAVVKDQETKIGENRIVQVGLVHELTAGVTLELRCGASTIKMESSGKISITGTELHLNATGDVFVKGKLIHLN
ncbi:MAG: type VI secretion system Vgr family protein [Sandaracinaceae bacterium]